VPSIPPHDQALPWRPLEHLMTGCLGRTLYALLPVMLQLAKLTVAFTITP